MVLVRRSIMRLVRLRERSSHRRHYIDVSIILTHLLFIAYLNQAEPAQT